jgi:hypothetical protein
MIIFDPNFHRQNPLDSTSPIYLRLALMGSNGALMKVARARTITN